MCMPEGSPNFSRSERNFSSTLQHLAMLVLCAILAVALGCGATSNVGNTTESAQPAGQIQVAISPSFASMAPMTQQQFTATVQGTKNSAVTWRASAGSISPDGTFTAPANDDGTPITITAISVGDSTQQANCIVNMWHHIEVAISPSSAILAPMAQQQFTATVRGTRNAAVSWHASAGSISLNGTFTAPATDNGTPITITATSAADATQHASSLVTLRIPSIQVAISPSSAILAPTAKQQFAATVRGASNTAVTWRASAGSISANGDFTAPATTDESQITITATSVADASQHASSIVTLQHSSPLTIATPALSGAVVDTDYNASLTANGGTPPYTWTTSSGTLAPGIQLGTTTGVFVGVPTQQGTYLFTVKVADAAAHSATQSFKLAVSAAVSSNGNFDGPAELPRVYLNTTLADTPAPGSAISVPAGGDLQAALDNANCGDTIALQAGATFVGPYTVPAKACDDQHWIIIRTNTPDANLPAEGTRMTPCYVGIASLPGRPAFSCTQPQKLLATITYPGASSGPITFADGANHYRLLGLEITRVANNGKPVVALVGPAQAGYSMDHIVVDRVYLHGTPVEETRRGVALSGGTNIAVQDSYLSDFHCNVQGTCTDAQAVSGGSGSVATGPIRIVDNFLEASGENILFGGGAATQTPADIEIRLNHFFKPMFWLQGQPGFKNPAFIVKNHFELKNAQRVLFDSNVLEDVWGGFTQDGFSIVLTPKNQSGYLCPICQVTDVTIRYVTISHVGGVFQISNGLDVPTGNPPLAGGRYSIHDVLVDDIDQVKYLGHGSFAQVSTIANPLLNNVRIDHVTAFPSHVLFNVGAPTGSKMPGFVFTNSIVTSGDSALTSTGEFGAANCANLDIPVTTVQQCFSGAVFSTNAILSAPAFYGPSKWPAGNRFYGSIEAVGFENFSAGNFQLLPSSPLSGAASDGTALGAHVDALLSDLSNVY